MKNVFILSFALIGTAVLLFGFRSDDVPSIDPEDVPGIIEMSAETQSVTKLYFDKWIFNEFVVPEGNPEQIKAEVMIDTRSLNADWKDLVKSIKKKEDYFYVKKFPTAQVMVDGATDNGDGTYTSEAEVTIKEITHTVPLTFTLSGEGPYELVGDGEIKRKKFDFTGGGPKWTVPVHFEATIDKEVSSEEG